MRLHGLKLTNPFILKAVLTMIPYSYSPGKKTQYTESNHSGVSFTPWVKYISLCMVIFLAFLPKILSAAEDAPGVRKAAIFVENRAGGDLNDKVSVLEDFLTSRITEKGFSILSREVVINSLNSYPPEGAKTLNTEEPDSKLDKLLSNNTSALRLAQMMGTDYIIVASIVSVGTEKKVFRGYGVETVNLITNLRASYKILDAVSGGTLVADTVTVSKTMRSMENSQIESRDVINELLDNASVKIAESLSQKQIAPPQKTNLVEITISCGMQDLAQLPISVPDVRLTENQKISIENNNPEVQVLDVTVELNGTVIGSAPGIFKVPPGLNKISLSREGFKDWERTINIINGQNLKVALQMTDAGYKRWKDNTDFLYLLKKDEKLTEAEVERIKGLAQMFRQSGFKVDIKEDIKGKTKTIFRFYR